jgi:Protein of unknown function (DUF938)
MPPTLQKGCPLSCGSLTDPDPRALASIAGHRTAADAPNLLSPLWLDAMSEEWPVQRADALVCINMIHITHWAACKGLKSKLCPLKVTSCGRSCPIFSMKSVINLALTQVSFMQSTVSTAGSASCLH